MLLKFYFLSDLNIIKVWLLFLLKGVIVCFSVAVKSLVMDGCAQMCKCFLILFNILFAVSMIHIHCILI